MFSRRATSSIFLLFIRLSYFRLIFLSFIILALYMQGLIYISLIESDQVAQFLNDLGNYTETDFYKVPRIFFTSLGDLVDIIASAIILLLIREILRSNSYDLLVRGKEELEPAKARRLRSYSRIFNFVVMALTVWILVRHHYIFTKTLVCGNSAPLLSASIFYKCTPHLEYARQKIGIGINLAGMAIVIALFIQILRGRARWLEQSIIGFLILAGCCALLIHLGTLHHPLLLAKTLGPFALVLFFHASILALLCAFLYPRGIVPLLLFALTIALSNVIRPEDKTRYLPAPASANIYRAPVAPISEYAGQFACRSFATQAGRAVPVFIVAAEGGGYYAAYFSARLLSQLFDKLSATVPQFEDHLYALSGVSGGGLGTALFSRALYHNKSRQSEITKHFFEYDFLSPMLASIGFVDSRSFFNSTILGFRTSASRNRATTLELAFEQAWSEAAGTGGRVSHAFSEDFLKWTDGEIPVVLNGTVANNGLPVLIAPFRLPWTSEQDGELNGFYNFSDLTERHIATSTAIGISARFPYIAPSAPIDPYNPGTKSQASRACNPGIPRKLDAEGRPVQECKVAKIVDGGYFDNSGVTTALLLANDFAPGGLRKCRDTEKTFKFIIIRIRTTDAASPSDEIEENEFRTYGAAPRCLQCSKRASGAIELYSKSEKAQCNGGFPIFFPAL